MPNAPRRPAHLLKPPRAPKKKMGRPSKYDPEFCVQLIDHMKQGKSLRAFAAKVNVTEDTIHRWLKERRDFSEARKRGEPWLEDFYIRMGQGIATGTLNRVASEEPVLGPDGQPRVDPRTGEVLIRREYERAHTNPTAWIFLCKNMLGWRDRRDVNHGGQPDGVPVQVEDPRQKPLTREERRAEIARLAKNRQECGDD